MKIYIHGLISILVYVLVCSYPALAGSSSILENDQASWYEGGKQKHAWLAINEAAVFVPKNTYLRAKALFRIRQALPGLIITGHSGHVVYLRQSPSKGSLALSKQIKEISHFQKTSPVFYRSITAKEETRMVLTGEIIVRFDPAMTPEMIVNTEKRYSLIRSKSFAFAKNTFIYDVGEPISSLELAEEIYESGEACYAAPNWIIACSRRVIPDDPLFSYTPQGYQWHLRNTDFWGEDVNIESVWDTYLGTHNEVVAIVDDGLEIGHADLLENVLLAYCWDFADGDNDPTAGDHGTCCGGVAAGRGFNGIGICGAAPQAGLVGHRLFNEFWEASFDSIAGSQTRNNQTIDIYSNSWGPDDGGYFLDDMPPIVEDALVSGITSGRGGLGSIFVWSAGNGYDADNSNYDTYANSRYTIAVSASTNQGLRADYSEKGANILVNAPSSGGTLAITTTDRTGSLGENIYDDYYYGFGGTSSSAPMVAGIVALMLQANPNLTWRDVQHVLIETAQRNDLEDLDWTINGAGFWVNHKYGFGRIDAQSAVNAAEIWTSASPEVSSGQTSSPGIAIPDNNTAGVSDTITILDKMIIESVEVVFRASDHEYWPDLEITLTSPDGTISTLAETHTPKFEPIGIYDNWKFCTQRHYKEISQGDWTLTVKDQKITHTGIFDSWTLKIYGTDTAAPEISDLNEQPANITENTATINWSTDEPSNSIICYSTTSGLNWNSPSMVIVSDPAITASHSITLEGLDTDKTYYYMAGSTDAIGNGPELNPNATNPSSERSFTTIYNAPVISDLGVSAYTETAATITWTTNESSDSVIRYGTRSSEWAGYPFTETDAAMLTSHTITLTNLDEDTTYYFRAGSTDLAASGPENHSNATNPSDEINFTTEPEFPSVFGNPVIDFNAGTISIRFDKSNMQGTLSESSYSFSPALMFRTQGGSDDIAYIGNNTYLLYFASVSYNNIYSLTMSTITDSNGYHLTCDTITINDYDNDNLPDGWEYYAGLDPADATGDNGANGDFDNDGWSNYEEYVNNTEPADDSSPAPTPPEILETHPHDSAGMEDVSRIPPNTSFSVRVADEDGIDITDESSIAFTIDDGTNPSYEVTLGNDDVVRVVKLSQDADTSVKNLWAVYDRSLDEELGDYPFDAIVSIVFEVRDIRSNSIEPVSYTFAIETELEHNLALFSIPPWNTIARDDPRVVGMYDTGIMVTGTSLIYAAVVYNSTEPVPPVFGATYEIPFLDILGASAVGVPVNIQPPTIFNVPLKVYIPCPGYTDPADLSVYGYNGSDWVGICDSAGIVSSDAQGWMVEGSRIDHVGTDPSSIEVRLYHCSGIVAAKSEAVNYGSHHSGNSSCFISISTLP